MVYLVSYSTSEFKKSQKDLSESALKNGVDRVLSFNDAQLKKTPFYFNNQKILDLPRGAGYWLWKPYYILETLQKLNENDFLIYLDSGIKVIDNLYQLVKNCENNSKGMMLFSDFRHKNSKYTKSDCFYLMDCLHNRYKESPCLNAGIQVYTRNNFTIKFIEEWLSYCTNENILTDIPNKFTVANEDDFIDHRHDQSVLSLMAAKYKLEIYRDPTQWGDYLKTPEYRNSDDLLDDSGYSLRPCENSNYPTLLYHHRMRKKTIGYYIKKLKKIFS